MQKVSKRVVLSAFNNQLNHLTESAGFCDFLLEQPVDQNPYLDEADYTVITGVGQQLYSIIDKFAHLIHLISCYENADKSSVED